MEKTIIIQQPDETRKLARDLAKRLPKGSLIYLTGDLGAGKTAFARGFVSVWDMEDQVTSPTFSIMNEYRSDGLLIYHFDLYRLTYPEELIELGIEDFIRQADYTLIEWPRLFIEEFSVEGINVDIHFCEHEMERKITITGDVVFE